MSTINVINHTIKKLEAKKNKISGFYICFASLKQDISLLRKIKIVLIEDSGLRLQGRVGVSCTSLKFFL